LAGGFGTRLRPITETRPKSLVPLVNRPLISHVIDSLPQEVDRVLLAVNYKREQLDDFLEGANEQWPDRELILVEEEEPLGTGGAVKNCGSHIDGSFLVLNGDVVTSLDLSDMLTYHKEKGGIGAISLVEVDDPSAYGVAKLDEDQKILSFVEKPPPGSAPSNLINAGAYILEPTILDVIEPGVQVSIEREVFPKILGSGLYGFPFDTFWTDAGTPSLFLLAQRYLLDKYDPPAFELISDPMFRGTDISTPLIVGEGCSLGPGSKLGPDVSLGDSVTGGSSCIITDSIILAGVNIGNDVQISSSIIGKDVIISDGVIITNGTVVADGVHIGPNLELSNEKVGANH